MKTKTGLFQHVPINTLVIVVLIMFLFQSFISMFYNNNNLTFYSIYSFYSLTKAQMIADSNWTNFGTNIPGLKEINGFLFPLVISILIKIVGQYNIIPVLYVLSFFVFLFVAILFYKIASSFLNGKYAIAVTIIFIICAPVVLSIFSGADVVLIFLLFALNCYYLYFYLPEKKYAPAIVTSIILLFTTYTGMLYGIASIAYILLFMNEKKLRNDYLKKILLFLSCFILFCIIFCSYVFIEKISPSFIEESVLVNNKTLYVNSFFKDGFLWSKLVPPFMSVFFFIGLYLLYANEIKEKKISFSTYVFLVFLVVFIMEFFAIFSPKTETLLFISMYFFIFILLCAYGFIYTAELLQTKSSIFSKNTIILGLILFFILYNIVWTFVLTVEKNNNIRHQHGNMYVERFFKK